jgi:hypothetical protein
VSGVAVNSTAITITKPRDASRYAAVSVGEQLAEQQLLDHQLRTAMQCEKCFERKVAEGDHIAALGYLSSTELISGLAEIWYDIPPTDRARVLGDTISMGDMLHQEIEFLVEALTDCRSRGELVTDCDCAHRLFAELPDRLDVYRGTVAAEAWPDYGVSWTLDKAVAERFAAGYRCSNRDSTPILMHARRVPKTAICGVLLDRNEHEVLLLPGTFWKNKPARLQRRWRQ